MAEPRGITLVELLIVLGMGTIILTGIGFASVDGFQRSSGRADRDLLIDSLAFARTRAQSGGCLAGGCGAGMPHGVFIGADAITVFLGSLYADRDPDFDLPLPRSGRAPFSGSQEYVFAAGSGLPLESGTTEVGEGVRYTVHVAENGRIDASVRRP